MAISFRAKQLEGRFSILVLAGFKLLAWLAQGVDNLMNGCTKKISNEASQEEWARLPKGKSWCHDKGRTKKFKLEKTKTNKQNTKGNLTLSAGSLSSYSSNFYRIFDSRGICISRIVINFFLLLLKHLDQW